MPALFDWLSSRPVLTIALVVGYCVATIQAHDLAQQLFRWLHDHLPAGVYRGTFLTACGLALVLATVHLTVRLRRQPLFGRRLLILAVNAALAGLALRVLMALSSESIHYIQFGLLAIPIFALTRRFGETVLWVTWIGVLDESYQCWIFKIHWDIYYDFNDVVLDAIGAALGCTAIAMLAPLAATATTRSWRQLLLRPVYLGSAAVVLSICGLLLAGVIGLYPPESGPEPWLLLSRSPPKPDFWTWPDWAPRAYHVLTALEGLVLASAVVLFHVVLDRHLDAGR